ncbi:hypothetical protein I314_00525 [Cryptococcus bacillisporus CA1873]|uniref:Uncharacterized protein n=2 Tax=Cryptococcus gattii TaxID=552467 RepID=A0A0D0UJ66_CRYGA|nr:hypothetical protein I312_02725 [Cryptococcus bacillisporus CA1280]KIR69414.1 hypothetical protein I314_00525 [Cryptococcus bacillisporus CA1873]|eukprot:KIR69414.1 hypothetical protein I314_00525 [Cryptococcus gattii CA1873]
MDIIDSGSLTSSLDGEEQGPCLEEVIWKFAVI